MFNRFTSTIDPLLALQKALEGFTSQFQNGVRNTETQYAYPAVNVFEKVHPESFAKEVIIHKIRNFVFIYYCLKNLWY